MASAAFGKQNPKQTIILSNSTFYNLSLEKSARTNFFFLEDTREGLK